MRRPKLHAELDDVFGMFLPGGDVDDGFREGDGTVAWEEFAEWCEGVADRVLLKAGVEPDELPRTVEEASPLIARFSGSAVERMALNLVCRLQIARLGVAASKASVAEEGQAELVAFMTATVGNIATVLDLIDGGFSAEAVLGRKAQADRRAGAGVTNAALAAKKARAKALSLKAARQELALPLPIGKTWSLQVLKEQVIGSWPEGGDAPPRPSSSTLGRYLEELIGDGQLIVPWGPPHRH